MSIKHDSNYYGFCGWSNWPAVLLCANVFDIFKIRVGNASIPKLVNKISGCSLGVYCIHMIVINVILRYLKLPTNSYGWMLIAPIVIYLLSLGCVFIGKKVPGLGRRVFP